MLFMDREEISRRLKKIDMELASIRKKMEKLDASISSRPFKLLAHQESELMAKKSRLIRELQKVFQN